MKILEKDLKQIVWEASTYELRERGFPISTFGKRFKDLKIGNYGTVDMILVDRVDGCLNISLCIFKEGKIGISAFLEAIKLKRGIERYLSKRSGIKKDLIQIYIHLIGSEIDTSGAFCFLTDIYYDISYYVYSFDLNGVSFKYSCNYSIADEGF